MAYVEHDVRRAGRCSVYPLVLGKALELVLDVFDRLTGQSRDRIETVKAAGLGAVANFAIFQFGIHCL